MVVNKGNKPMPEPANDTFITKISGVSALLSVVVQFGAIGIAVSLGTRPGGAINFGDGTQLLAANANHTTNVLGVSLATLSPALALPLWPLCDAEAGKGLCALGRHHVLRGDDNRLRARGPE